MKLRIYPTKAVVLEMYNKRLSEQRAHLVEEQDELVKLEAGTNSAFYNPYSNTEIADTKRLVIMHTENIQALEETISIVESHSPPEVMVEMDL